MSILAMSEVEFYASEDLWSQGEYLFPDYSGQFDGLSWQVSDVAETVRSEASGIRQQAEAIQRENVAAEAAAKEETEAKAEDYRKQVFDYLDSLKDIQHDVRGIYDRVMLIDAGLERDRHEKDSALVEERSESDSEILLSASDTKAFESDNPDTETVAYTVTLNDIHDDLLVLNDNLIYANLFQFAAILALLGLILGKELWKNW